MATTPKVGDDVRIAGMLARVMEVEATPLLGALLLVRLVACGRWVRVFASQVRAVD